MTYGRDVTKENTLGNHSVPPDYSDMWPPLPEEWSQRQRPQVVVPRNHHTDKKQRLHEWVRLWAVNNLDDSYELPEFFAHLDQGEYEEAYQVFFRKFHDEKNIRFAVLWRFLWWRRNFQKGFVPN